MENNNFALQPFTYHKKLRDHFKSRSKTWEWFAQKNIKEEQIEELKSELLKNTYRLDENSNEELYSTTKEVCASLAIDTQVTYYQEHNSVQLNAGIIIVEKEAHIVFSGGVLSLLSKEELKALIAHELSHYLFYKIENEEYENTQRIILALANDSRSENAIIETARIFQLYMELFCDAGALHVCKDHKVVIRTLVKLNTGLTQVNADSYLQQAKEILNRDKESTLDNSHPESYIRSVALQLRANQSKTYFENVEAMIQGDLDLDSLDIFEQHDMQNLTHELLQLVVKPKWMNSSAVVNLCNQYFNSFYRKPEELKVDNLVEKIERSKPSVKNFLSYVLLDFAKVDEAMEGVPLGHSLEIAELLGLKNEFEKIVRKELKLTSRAFKLMQETVLKDLQDIKESKEDSIYND
ncbi:MAG: M48 family metalloprotease [Vicingaceae bacterium]